MADNYRGGILSRMLMENQQGFLTQQNGYLSQLAQQLRQPAQANDPSWYRADGTKKGMGFLGQLPSADGRTSTELSIGVDLGGNETDIPSLVPTLSPAEVNHMLNGNAPTPEIIRKAAEHAMQRRRSGLSVFAGENDAPAQLNVPWRRP